MAKCITEISKGIRSSIEEGIYPNTIRLNPVDVKILEQEIGEPELILTTILGLRIEESQEVEVGKALIYSDKKLENFLK